MKAKPIKTVTVVVTAIDEPVPGIKRFVLTDPDGWTLPPFRPGAHIDVHLASGLVRTYSLCNEPADGERYVIAVKREDAGRGGSRYMHDELQPGAVLGVSIPRGGVPLHPSATNILTGVTIPTFNPYYPVGGPTGGSTLRAYYNIGWESPSITSFYELAQRYQLGLTIALPGAWSGRVWYAMTNDANYNIVRGTTNKAAVSAALGWTIASTPVSGTTPGIAAWTKPSSVPYLNLLCDPLAYQCNSPDTIAYVQGIRDGALALADIRNLEDPEPDDRHGDAVAQHDLLHGAPPRGT